jgi:hypothetical protein
MVVPHSELFVFLCPAPPSPAISRMFRQKRANPVWARLFVSIGVHQAATTELRQCSRFATRAKICCRSRRRDFTLPFFHHKLSMLRQPSWRNWMKYFNLFVAFTLWLELVGAASSVANGAELSTEYRGAHPPRVQHRAAAAITACGLRCRTVVPPTGLAIQQADGRLIRRYSCRHQYCFQLVADKSAVSTRETGGKSLLGEEDDSPELKSSLPRSVATLRHLNGFVCRHPPPNVSANKPIPEHFIGPVDIAEIAQRLLRGWTSVSANRELATASAE